MWLRKNNALSRIMMGEGVTAAYKTRHGERARVVHRDRASNISDWLDPHIADLAAKGGARHNFRDHRQFRVYRRAVNEGRDKRLAEEIGFEVHLDARPDATGDFRTAEFNGMHNWKASTALFRYDLEDTIDFLLAPCFQDVPPAQNAKPEKYANDASGQERKGDRERQAKDVRKAMHRRGFREQDRVDLEECLERLANDETLEFDWEVGEYRRLQVERRRANPESVDGKAAEFKRLVIDKGYAVGTIAMVQAEDDAALFWMAKIVAHKPEESEVIVNYYQAVGDTNTAEPKRRKYQLTLNRERVHMTALQAPDIQMSGNERARARKLTPDSQQVLGYWLDTRKKILDRASYDSDTDSDKDGENEDSDDDKPLGEKTCKRLKLFHHSGSGKDSADED